MERRINNNIVDEFDLRLRWSVTDRKDLIFQSLRLGYGQKKIAKNIITGRF